MLRKYNQDPDKNMKPADKQNPDPKKNHSGSTFHNTEENI